MYVSRHCVCSIAYIQRYEYKIRRLLLEINPLSIACSLFTLRKIFHSIASTLSELESCSSAGSTLQTWIRCNSEPICRALKMKQDILDLNANQETTAQSSGASRAMVWSLSPGQDVGTLQVSSSYPLVYSRVTWRFVGASSDVVAQGWGLITCIFNSPG